MIFLACLLTVIIETPFLAAFGYRSRDALLIVICANIVTNLLLNLVVSYLFLGHPGVYTYVLEALVVAAEFFIYSLAFGSSLRLFFLTLAANCLSYGIGCIIFRFT